MLAVARYLLVLPQVEEEQEDIAGTAVGKHASVSDDEDADEVMSAEIEYSDGAGARSSRTASVATSSRRSSSSEGPLGAVLLDVDELQVSGSWCWAQQMAYGGGPGVCFAAGH
jgi:hypothetical protein